MSEDLQPVNYSSSDGLLQARENSAGAVHYYQREFDGGPQKEVKGDEFAEQMVPGLLEERKKHLEEHAEEAREWKHREKAGNLINDEGRLLTPEGKLAFPTKKDKAKEIGKKITIVVKNGAEGIKGVSNETKDKVMEALAANRVEEARRMLQEAGVDLKDVEKGHTKRIHITEEDLAEKPEQEAIDKRGSAIFTSRKGDKFEITVTDAFKDSHNNRVYYKAEGRGKDAGKKFDKLNANLVEFEDTSEAKTGIIDNSEKDQRREFLETVLKLQEEVEKRFNEEAGSTTHIDLHDPAVKSHLMGQIREKVVDEHMQTLPEDQKSDKKLKGRLLDALKEDPDKLRGELDGLAAADSNGDRELGNKIGSPGEMEIRGQDDKGSPFIYRKNEKGEWVVSRNGDLAKEWFPATAEGMKRDIGIDLISSAPAPEAPGGGGGSDRGGYEGVVTKNEEGGVDVEAMEASMARIKALNEELKTASPERAQEIQKEIEAEIAKMYKVWEEAPEETVEETSEVAEETPEDKKEGKRPRWRRAWDKAKFAATYPWNRAYSYMFMETDPKKRRRRGLGMLAGGLLMGYLLSRYGLHHGGGGGGQEHGGIFPGPDHTPEHGGHGIEHQTFFESAAGHRRTGLVLPENLHPGHDLEGHRVIMDSNGNVVVSHAEAPSIAKDSGVLSDKAAEVLRNKGYTVGYMPMDNVAGTNSNLYESVVS